MVDMRNILSLFLLLGSITFTKNAYSLDLSIEECVKKSIEKNLDIKIEDYSNKINELNYIKALDEFSLSIGLQPEIRKEIRPTSNSFISGGSVLEQFNQTYGIYIMKNLSTGGNIKLNFDNGILGTNSDRVDFNPVFSQGISINFNQPLLRNSFIGSKKIKIAENNKFISKNQFSSKVNDIIINTQNAYWDLFLNKLKYESAEKNLDFVKKILEMNKNFLKLGKSSEADIISLEVSVLNSEASLYQFSKQLKDSEDNLNIIIGNNLDENINPITYAKFNDNIIDINKSLEYSKNNYDIKIAKANLENSMLQKEISEKNRLPNLSLQTSAGLQGTNKSYSDVTSDTFSFKNYFWDIGLNLDLPIQGNINETEYQSSLINLEKIKVQLTNTEQKNFNDLREAIRRFEVSKQKYFLTEKSKLLSDKQLKIEEERFKKGFSTTFQIIQYAKDSLQNDISYYENLIENIKAQNNLKKLEALLLKEYGFIID